MTQATFTSRRSFASILRDAAAGDVLTTELISLTNKGKLRIHYNWLYSALNCDPGDTSTFAWVIAKIDDTQVSLSPRDGYRGMTLYASVRDDWSWYVQVQAPHSADWITAVGRDEKMVMAEPSGLLTMTLTGFNGQLIAVDDSVSSHQGLSGYRLRSIGSSDAHAYTWFLGVQQVLQEGLAIPLAREVTTEHIHESLAAAGLACRDHDVQNIQRLLA
jgi:hypothetical protein